ncbi:MAG: PH domain-containing protein [Acidimicrobiales bacterium]
MPFPKELLSQNETVALDLRPHWWYIAPAAAYLAVAAIIGIFVLVNAGDNAGWSALKFIAGIAVLITLGNFAIRYAKWHTTNFVVTDERVISRSGVVAKKGIEIPLDRINTVFFHQSFFERLIGAGDLGIESAGEGGRENFSDVRKPALVQQQIYQQKEVLEASQHSRLGASIAASMQQVQQPAPPSFSIPDQIEQLDRLRKAGALTEDEFQLKKAELLRRL